MTFDYNPESYTGFQFEHPKEGGIVVHCDRYVDEVIQKFRITKYLDTPCPGVRSDGTVKPHELPYDLSVSEKDLVLAKVEASKVDKALQLQYRSIVGSLLYAANLIRLDIAFAVHRLSRYLVNCGPLHLQQAYYVIGYLIHTTKMRPRLTYPRLTDKKLQPALVAYSDCGYISDEFCKSVTGMVILLGGRVISWQASLQSINALSACEGEFIALAATAKMAIFFMQLLLEEGVDTRRFRLYEDNTSCIRLVAMNMLFQRSKHISNRFFFLRQVAATLADVHHVESKNQLADMFTKAVASKPQFYRNLGMLLRLEHRK